VAFLDRRDGGFDAVAEEYLGARRDFAHCPPVRMRYAVLASPRSGSELLGQMLLATRAAGDPIEYLSVLQRARVLYAKPQLSPAGLLRQMEGRRTSANGLFGAKLHYAQLQGAFGGAGRREDLSREARQFLRGFQKFIWIRRRQRLQQAVSLAIARRTKRWSSVDPRPPAESLTADSFALRELVNALHFVCANDLGWAKLIRRLGLDVLELWYEDLVAEYDDQCRRVLAHLGVQELVAAIPEPITRRQSGALNQALLERLKAYLSS
jgi:LPS sulfotransferase NodH